MNRFWDKVRQGFPDECWEWTGGTRNGYGMFAYEPPLPVSAHRMAAYLHGLIPSPYAPHDKLAHGFIRHTCDNRLCCNPAHMLVGTYAENHADKIERKRHPRTYGAHGGRLGYNDIAKIHTMRAEGHTHEEIAAALSCSTRTVNRHLKTP